jgi:hypothetical protein
VIKSGAPKWSHEIALATIAMLEQIPKPARDSFSLERVSGAYKPRGKKGTIAVNKEKKPIIARSNDSCTVEMAPGTLEAQMLSPALFLIEPSVIG